MKMAKPAYTTARRVDSSTKPVKRRPIATHRIPAVMPPTSAGTSRTRVFGISAYTNVNTALPSANGASESSTPPRSPSSGSCESARTELLAEVICAVPISVPTSSGATTSNATYSAMRRMKLRGWSTCQTKLTLSSTFLIVPISVQIRNARPTEPTMPPRTRSAKSMTFCVSSPAASPMGRKNS